MSDFLAHCTPWPEALAAEYRRKGYWRGQTFNALLDERVEQYGERLAVVSGQTRWSYRDLAAEADYLAKGFSALGIGPKDRVVVQLPNCAEFFSVIFALFRIGALPVFALPAHRKLEISYFCQHAEAVAYIIADQHGGFDYRNLASEVKAVSPSLQHVLVLGDAGPFTALHDLAAGPLPAPPKASDVAFFQLSGGSTGTPKLIPRTHDDYIYSLRGSAEICQLSPESVYLCVLPAGHNFALSSPGSLGVFYAGGTVVLSSNSSPDHVFPLIAAEQVSISALVPPLVPIWLDAAASLQADLSSLKVVQVGGARFNSEMAARLVRELGCTLQQVFGMAEGLVNYTRYDDSDALVLHSQGRPISPDDEIRVVDDEDQPLPVGEVGHLLTRGPYTIHGYYRAAEHNARSFTADGFYRTGDLVRQTAEGYLVVEGRAKDQINRGGEKISAEEVEHLLLAHQGVADVAIVAMPDAFLGEKSCAFVIRRDASLRAVELNAYLRKLGIAAYKIPDRIEFIDAFPKTGVGKVSKKILRQIIEQRLLVPS
ncbi:(2,3-dihydroxybenzoyl)adenylate synthase [Janthinobacterium sp. B9-8]|uniref:(2,3-dihydroxybenzoyl)adenylate synthase n=1 Tax=Janthinobacterium sp. B9-8 TaxID=1236179 RepID=UPI00061CF46E|nr:(2,3-dihydroxybenzoyl)adenylate synthase [Janthinobacterium sp. B9-8]AMC36187.1 2,3-dihydroxybenzoate-AMP ligase [Janthinobacterium sp. B9-8]